MTLRPYRIYTAGGLGAAFTIVDPTPPEESHAGQWSVYNAAPGVKSGTTPSESWTSIAEQTGSGAEDLVPTTSSAVLYDYSPDGTTEVSGLTGSARLNAYLGASGFAYPSASGATILFKAPMDSSRGNGSSIVAIRYGGNGTQGASVDLVNLEAATGDDVSLRFRISSGWAPTWNIPGVIAGTGLKTSFIGGAIRMGESQGGSRDWRVIIWVDYGAGAGPELLVDEEFSETETPALDSPYLNRVTAHPPRFGSYSLWLAPLTDAQLVSAIVSDGVEAGLDLSEILPSVSAGWSASPAVSAWGNSGFAELGPIGEEQSVWFQTNGEGRYPAQSEDPHFEDEDPGEYVVYSPPIDLSLFASETRWRVFAETVYHQDSGQTGGGDPAVFEIGYRLGTGTFVSVETLSDLEGTEHSDDPGNPGTPGWWRKRRTEFPVSVHGEELFQIGYRVTLDGPYTTTGFGFGVTGLAVEIEQR